MQRSSSAINADANEFRESPLKLGDFRAGRKPIGA